MTFTHDQVREIFLRVGKVLSPALEDEMWGAALSLLEEIDELKERERSLLEREMIIAKMDIDAKTAMDAELEELRDKLAEVETWIL